MPLNRSGKPFRYIGEVQGFSYCDGGIQAIMLFYDPDEQIALVQKHIGERGGVHADHSEK